MKFSTPVSLPPQGIELKPQQYILFAGSCFSDHIGEKMAACMPRGHVATNPNGTIYNPLSILRTLAGYLPENCAARPEGYFLTNTGEWRHWDYATRFTAMEKDMLENELTMHEAETRKLFKRLDTLFITFSTDHIYTLKAEGAYHNHAVANCHKQPSALFEEKVMDIEACASQWTQLMNRMQELRPGIRFVFTLSPYRYTKYGMHGNALSKARLLLLIEDLCQHPSACYFPAYEIVTDELRDYRFYASDMLHPSQQAIDYVWERFAEWAFTPDMKAYATEKEALEKAMNHRPLHPQSPEYERFRQGLKERQRQFISRWGEL